MFIFIYNITMSKLLFIFLGGGIGASARYAMTLYVLKLHRPLWMGTLTVNTLGCLAIGYIAGLMLAKPNFLPEDLKLGLTVGFLGGLTTFSTFSLETFVFFKEGKPFTGLGYMLVSCVLGLSCAGLGYWLSSRV